MCIECLLANRHKDQQIVSLDKAFKSKIAEYRNMIKSAEGLLSNVQNCINDCCQTEKFLSKTETDVMNKIEETFRCLQLYFDASKSDLMARASRAFKNHRVSFQSYTNDLKNLLSSTCVQIDYQNLSLDQFAKEVVSRKASISKMEEMTRSPMTLKNDIDISFSDKDIDNILKNVRNELSKITEKTGNQSGYQACKVPDRPITPSRSHLTASKSNVKQIAESKTTAFYAPKETSYAPSTPRLTKDVSKKSLTRSKSPIFKTDIRRLNIMKLLKSVGS
jgi:hypothetical protein